MAQFSNRFTAANTKDVPTLRRATNNAFTDLVRQMNSNLGAPPVVNRESEIPVRPSVGALIYLESGFAHSNGNTLQVGWYLFNGDSWERLMTSPGGF